MNRNERVREVLRLEGIAAAAKRRAGEHRQQLATEAHAELEFHGTAPTWRMPDIGTVTLPLSQEAPAITDIALLLTWVKERHPEEVETVHQVRAAFQTALLQRAVCDGDLVIDPQSGEVIPGMTVRPGGRPGALTFRVPSDIKDVYAALGDSILEALDEPTGAEVPS